MAERKAETVGELRAAGYKVLSVKAELRKNLMQKIRKADSLVTGIMGYEESVLPQIANAILSGQDMRPLGDRGQPKSRIIRSLIGLLDPEIPIVAGCEINDDPFAPICLGCRTLVAEKGDDTPVAWLPREKRYGEKLATPDITIAD